MDLTKLGWNNFFEEQLATYHDQEIIAARVIKQVRHLYKVYTTDGVIDAEVSGHFHFTAIDKSDYPTVGDWVLLKKSNDFALIEKIMQRKTIFSRNYAGNETEEQVVAANIDYLSIVCGLDGGRNFNLRGIERYIAMTVQGGAKPILILNKVDLCADREKALLDAKTVSSDNPIHMVSALTKEGINELSKSFPEGSTLSFCGQSGVGKSSLINALKGEDNLKTGEVRASDLRGKHTTTHSELFFLESGAMVIDTPGMRELQLWGDEDSLQDTFSEISEAAKNCRFSDCTHQGEPGCAVQELLTEGSLSIERYENYLEMRSELQFLESRVDAKKRLERKAQEKDLSKRIKTYYKNK
jgi:ribosome biogenesis GTPase